MIGKVTKKSLILAAWDRGVRDKREIARQAGSTVNGVTTLLSQEGRLAGRMPNGPTAFKGPRAAELWNMGERDLGVIARKVGSASRQSVYELLRRAGVDRPQDALKDLSHERCHLPWAIVDEAERRGEKPAAFAHRLLTCVAEGNLYVAVLDDG